MASWQDDGHGIGHLEAADFADPHEASAAVTEHLYELVLELRET